MFIYGKSTVQAALSTNKKIEVVYFASQKIADPYLKELNQKKIAYSFVSQKFLDDLIDANHQGIAARVGAYSTVSLDKVLAQSKGKYSLLVMLDSLKDPHNLGAILRTAEATAVDGVIIGKHRSVGLTPTVAKVSTGAIEYVKVVEATNLTQTLEILKKKGFWVIGAEYDVKSQFYDSMKYDMPVVLVIGSEGEGISRLVKEHCDVLVKLPMKGQITSLNASVSAGILLYEISKYR